MSKVLNIGCTSEYMCNNPKKFFPGSEIYTMDIDPKASPNYVQDITKDISPQLIRRFDAVFMSHVLEHIYRKDQDTVIENCKVMLKPGGQLWVFVPSLEWVCNEVVKGHMHLAIQGALYGGQKDEWDTHKVAFTLPLLRGILAKHGFTVKKYQLVYYRSIIGGKDFICGQDMAMGVK